VYKIELLEPITTDNNNSLQALSNSIGPLGTRRINNPQDAGIMNIDEDPDDF
jgi:hypothetical protein